MRVFVSILILATTSAGFSQILFPDLSAKGKLEQKVGFTIISVEYERPAARGRIVFGKLVPYGKLWRTGAGNCTKIRFSDPVYVDNKRINQGTYSLFTIPDKNEWTIILNSDTTLYGTSAYDDKKEMCRFKTQPQLVNRYHESFTIDIDVIPNNARIYLSWTTIQVSFGVLTESDKRVDDFIASKLFTGESKNSEEYAMAAEYKFYLDKNLDQALLLIDEAIAGKSESWYYRQKIDILEKQGKYKEAINCANRVIVIIQNRAEWDLNTRQQSIQEYNKRIESLTHKLKKKTVE
jgi:tetratricopeptide (TPR) repeat protein